MIPILVSTLKIHQVGEKVAEPVSVAKSSMKSRIKASLKLDATAADY